MNLSIFIALTGIAVSVTAIYILTITALIQ